MPNVEKQRERLISLLKELFQLDQPDLDFGFYRIMHAKAGQVTKFLEEDLLGIIRNAFGEADGARVEQAKAVYEAARKQAEEFGAPDPDAAPKVKEAKAAWDAAKDSGSNEGDVYDHLYRFFERYYDNGDFMSRRYFARETDGKAAPYAVPYDGREVYLHWANRDQYYIKTSEYLTNFTFDPTQAKEFQDKHGALFEQKPLKVHCRIVSASEGEHNNVKASEQTERYFIIHEPEPIKIETGDTSEPELVIQFQYRPDPEKTGQDGTWRKKRLGEAADKVRVALPDLEGAGDYATALMTPAPTEAEKDRTLLAKYLAQYTGRNTMDYFIHKDLGGFLRRELDFYIKNEVMRLDDIESADAPRVEAYLAKVKVLRRIAQHLIDFLAQLEEYQKRLWLKKKFVVDSHYCISLDLIPEDFYPAIVANQVQREEWVRLFSVEELEGYSTPLSVEFLRKHPQLIVDTGLYPEAFRDSVLASIEDLDQSLNGVLVHSNNSHALRLLSIKYASEVQTTYIDPPYNTGSDGFVYRDSLKSSSWTTMMHERLSAFGPLMSDKGVIFCSINEIQRAELDWCMRNVFGPDNRVEELIWARDTVSNNAPAYSTNHEYIEVFAKSRSRVEAEKSMFREERPGYAEVRELIEGIANEFPSIDDVESALKGLYAEHRDQFLADAQELGLSKEEAKKADPWKGLYPYKFAEYRDAHGKWIEEADAKESSATIWVYREVEPSMPSGKQAADIRDSNSENYRFFAPPHPASGEPCKPPKRGWAFPEKAIGSRPSFEGYRDDHRIVFKTDATSIPQLKYFLHEVGSVVSTSVIRQYSDGEPKLEALFGEKGFIDNPKPPALVEKLIRQTTDNRSWIMDFFAGSGTTASAVIDANRSDDGQRRFILCEVGSYFDTVLRPRAVKSAYSSSWSEGTPEERDGISILIKYIRLESYEDALNNLSLAPSAKLDAVSKEFARDYILRYWLDFETKGSPSLLNIEWFDDPTAYKLKIKKPGTDEYVEKAVDLVETFNWLIGLHVEHLDRWRGYDAAFKREPDPGLPEDTNTRLMLDGALKETDDGAWRFRKVEGYTLRTPGDHNDRDKALVVWRKLTGDPEQDNLMLDEWFRKYRLSAQDTEFDVIYVNGSNNLPNLRKAEETWKVRLIEEAFHQAMWDVEG